MDIAPNSVRMWQQTAVDGAFAGRANSLPAEGTRENNALRRQCIQIRRLKAVDLRLRFSRIAFTGVIAEILDVDEEDIGSSMVSTPSNAG